MYSHGVVDTGSAETKPLEMNSEGELDGESDQDDGGRVLRRRRRAVGVGARGHPRADRDVEDELLGLIHLGNIPPPPGVPSRSCGLPDTEKAALPKPGEPPFTKRT